MVITARMIKYFCKVKNISCLGFDQKSKVFLNGKEELNEVCDDIQNKKQEVYKQQHASINQIDDLPPDHWSRPNKVLLELHSDSYRSYELYHEYEFPPEFAYSSTPWLGIPKPGSSLFEPKDEKLDDFIKKMENFRWDGDISRFDLIITNFRT